MKNLQPRLIQLKETNANLLPEEIELIELTLKKLSSLDETNRKLLSALRAVKLED